jgi:hypothetical protein
MAQADFVVANGTGAAVRSDLNGQLAAIVSNNSGATEPATMYAYQWWADTTTGLLKIRNSANSAWVTVGTLASANLGLLSLGGGTMTGALLADDSGTAALPAISFDGDSDTGIFRAGANELAAATNGTQRLTVDSSGRLLIGTSTARSNFFNSSATAQVQIEGTDADNSAIASINVANNAGGGRIYLAKGRGGSIGSNTVVQNADTLGIITFQGNDGTEFVSGAEIEAFVDGAPGANDLPTALKFSTTADGASSPTERFRVSNDGSFSSVIPGGSTLYPSFDCRAWVNFNGTGAVAIRGSGNVSSITDNGTGDYTVNFTTAMPDANYTLVCSASNDGYNTGTCHATPTSTFTTTAVQIFADGISGAANARIDATRNFVAIFR